VPAVWDDPDAAWSAFDVVVVRSCWDYHLWPDAFDGWIEGLVPPGLLADAVIRTVGQE
jgi:hypothetical protein